VQPLVTIDARDAYSPQLRGWGRYARYLVDALGSGGFEGLELRVLGSGRGGPEVLFEQLKLPVVLRRNGAALVHATNCFLPLVRPCPGVVTVQDLAFEAWPNDFVARTRIKYRVLARLAAWWAERIICPSAFTRADMCARWGVDAAKVRVIPLAAALPICAENPPEGPYLLAVGDLRRKKNLEQLVGAFVSLRRREGIPHRLVLAGVDSGLGPALREQAAGEPLALTGYIGDAQLDALIRGADVLVHPSLYEGFGLVVLEAMARGTPVLAARATALPEAGGDAAAYFEPEDPDGLTRTLGALLADPGARAELSRKGLARASEFSWQRTARETVGVYRELV
jgi:glycosyltransferase involved in cell wall biosynthesis